MVYFVRVARETFRTCEGYPHRIFRRGRLVWLRCTSAWTFYQLLFSPRLFHLHCLQILAAHIVAAKTWAHRVECCHRRWVSQWGYGLLWNHHGKQEAYQPSTFFDPDQCRQWQICRGSCLDWWAWQKVRRTEYNRGHIALWSRNAHKVNGLLRVRNHRCINRLGSNMPAFQDRQKFLGCAGPCNAKNTKSFRPSLAWYCIPCALLTDKTTPLLPLWPMVVRHLR